MKVGVLTSTQDDDNAWEKKKRDYAPLEMSYTLDNKKWLTANKNCMAFIKNTIEHAIVGSIGWLIVLIVKIIIL